MANNKVDVRITKTKDRLKRALLQLLKEKSLDKISISEICSLASVNRNTFYAHYTSLKELLEEIESQLLESVINNIKCDQGKGKSITELLYNILECVRDNKDLCSILFTENGDKDFLVSLLMFAFPTSVKNWSTVYNISEKDASRFYYFVISGVACVVKDWIKNGLDASSMELAQLLNNLILYGQNSFDRNKAQN